ncbi:MAG: amidophosphoribosyltransferase [Candidatus Altiarchaeota archaeon]|nr:amidophosphoribosyltransferase [Candidatus Altiarchaeota archaeon]
MAGREKCAVFGVRSDKPVFESIYYALYSMQHRGQEAAGIATYNSGINLHRDEGLVCEVFKGVFLEGNAGVGHVRYSTSGSSDVENAQPLVINYAKGSFALAHNGNLVNTEELKHQMESRGSVFITTSDTEIIAQLIAQEHLRLGDFIEGVKQAVNQLKGSYSLVILKGDNIIAVRDPWAFKPLVLGKLDDSFYVASESCALDAVNAELVRDVRAGEIVVIGDTLQSYRTRKERKCHCMFEYVYFARPDSVIDGVSVYGVRRKLGEILAREAPAEADLVVAVPDSGITAAIGYSRASGILYGEGLIKNRYFGRTFILPKQAERDVGVRIKLNPIRSEIKGKKLVLVDDSIVRGTTVKRIINLLRDFGAAEVHVRVSCPPVKNPCYYGIDMQTPEEFIAQKKGVEDIRKEIGADSLAYNTIDSLVEAIGLPAENLCLACVNGSYPIKEEQLKLNV